MNQKKEYIKLLADHISVIVDDLTDNELSLIDRSYELFTDKLRDMKDLTYELYRLNITLVNLKAMQDDRDYDKEWDDSDEFVE